MYNGIFHNRLQQEFPYQQILRVRFHIVMHVKIHKPCFLDNHIMLQKLFLIRNPVKAVFFICDLHEDVNQGICHILYRGLLINYRQPFYRV